MTVYLIRAGLTGPVKIGHANDVQRRLLNLQVAHYERLHLIRQWEGGAAEEAVLQLRFADLCIRGEWYAFSELMLGDVGLVSSAPKAPKKPTRAATVGTDLIRSRRGLAVNIARLLGLNRSAISQWHDIPAEYVPLITENTGILPHLLRPDIWPNPMAKPSTRSRPQRLSSVVQGVCDQLTEISREMSVNTA